MSDRSGQPFSYVDSASALQQLLPRLRSTKRIAVDLEADSLHHYFEKVCLIQLAFDEQIYVVDPLAELDLGDLLGLLSEHRMILHAGENDIRLLRRLYDFVPRGEIFDTMIAAQLLGYPRLGMAAVVEHYFGVRLSKRGQKSNWSRRPLTPAQLRYACQDVVYLEGLREKLGRDLRKRGRSAWLTQTVRRMVQRATQDPLLNPRSEDPWRIKGTSRLDRRQLGAVRELWHWRDGEARRLDQPPFWILDDGTLFELALWVLEHPRRSLTHGPDLPRSCRGRRLRALEQIVRKCRRLPEAEWPEPRKRERSPRPPAVTRTLQEHCAAVAEGLGIETSVLAPRATLEAIALARPRTAAEIQDAADTLPWQAGLLEPIVLKVLHDGSDGGSDRATRRRRDAGKRGSSSGK